MITLCIPTKDRSAFLARVLWYYARTRFRHHILVGDSSGPGEAQRNQRAAALLKGQLDVEYLAYPCLSSCAVMEQMGPVITTPYCAYIADDDFLCPGGMERCVEFLERHPE